VAGAGDFVDVFVNVGRREGASASDFERILTEAGVVSPAEMGRVRVRDRNAFVSVRRFALEKAVRALTGATIGGKVVDAEPARARSSGTSSPNEG
jgi:ATP-dependent RNA helicase DeaD